MVLFLLFYVHLLAWPLARAQAAQSGEWGIRAILTVLLHGNFVQVMLLDQGRIAEYDTPATLLSNPQSKFYALCKATGKEEFAVLKKMAGV